MSQQETATKFDFSYAELMAQALEKQAFLERDQDELAVKGITADNLAEYATKMAAFQAINDDGVFKALESEAVQIRNAAQEALGVKLRNIAGTAANVLGDKSAQYRTFGYDKIAGAEPPLFLLQAEIIADRADAYRPQLDTKGIDGDYIAAVRTDITAFQQTIKDVATAAGNRDVATQTRRAAANTLYDIIVNLADLAKILYVDTNEAKYNDYIIYHKSSTAQSRNGRLKAKQTLTRELSAMTADTSIIIQNDGEAALEAYFSQHKDGAPAPEGEAGIFVSIPSHEKKTFIAGENLGYNPDIQATFFTLRNPSEDKSVIYRVRIE